MSVKSKVGRKNQYEEKVAPFLKDVEKWAAAGWTERAMRRRLDVDSHTWVTYKQEHPDLKQALLDGMEAADGDVKNALFRSACGYDFEEKTYKGRKLIQVVKKHQAENVAAQCFWLSNRDSEHWKNRQSQQLTDANGKEFVLHVKYDQPGVKS